MLRAFALPLLSALAIAANGSRVIAANGSSVIPANTSVNATPGPAHATAPNAALENLTSFGWTNHGISEGTWSDGRATWYAGPNMPGALKKGSCGFGKLGNKFVSAINTNGGYDWGLTGKCGRCYEVMCVEGPTRGLKSSEYGPYTGCKAGGRISTVVKITDSCPCHGHGPSNKRWCCGDKVHFDLSYKAFGAIAKKDKGVVDLKIRKASCYDQGKVFTYGDTSVNTNKNPQTKPVNGAKSN